MNKKIAQMVTDRIVAIMEEGRIPWNKPWRGVSSGAISHSTGRAYSLLNQFMMEPGEYITFNQIKAEGGKLKKGSKGEPVIFWKMYTKEDEEGKEVSIPVLRYYTVFNVKDCEGITAKYYTEEEKEPRLQPVPAAEKIACTYVAKSGVKLQNDKPSDRAYYSPVSDSVVVPMLDQYEIEAEYYSTLFHELTHSTGHASRLNRLSKLAAFGSEEYSKEELTAEIGAAILTATAGLDTSKTERNSAAYLQSWLRALKNDPTMIVSAAGKAEKAVDLIMEGVDLSADPEAAEAASAEGATDTAAEKEAVKTAENKPAEAAESSREYNDTPAAFTASATWKKCAFYLSKTAPAGTPYFERVEGYVKAFTANGCTFCIGINKRGNHWYITHCQTGALVSVYGYNTLKEAKSYIENPQLLEKVVAGSNSEKMKAAAEKLAAYMADQNRA